MTSHAISYASRAAEADRKRAAAKKLIQQYYYQLTEGCGDSQCGNEHCASNNHIQKLEPNQAAALALRLFKAKARLCIIDISDKDTPQEPKYLTGCPSTHMHEAVPVPSDSVLDGSISVENRNCMDIESNSSGGSGVLEFPSTNAVNPSKKIALSPPFCDASHDRDTTISEPISKRNQILDSGSELPLEMPSFDEDMCVEDINMGESKNASPAKSTAVEDTPTKDGHIWENPSTSDTLSRNSSTKSISFLDEDRLQQVIDVCIKEENFSLLIRTLGQIFSSEESLQSSFTKSVKVNCKEDIRAMEVDEDKDKDTSKEEQEDSSSTAEQHTKWEVTVDVESLRRAYKSLFSLKKHPFQHALINALIILSENLEYDFKYGSKKTINGTVLNIFVIVMEIPILECPEYMEAAFPAFCKAASQLPVCAQAKLANFWSSYEAYRLKEMVDTLHQFITLKVITGQFMREYCINDDESIVAATKLMKVLYYANMLGGGMDMEPSGAVEDSENVEADDNFQDIIQGAIGSESKEQKQIKEDPLSQELGFKPIDCRTPIISFEEFYNEPLSDQLEMDRDFACYKTEGGKFSFMNYAFILTPAVKALGLYYDNRIRMYSERRISVLHSLVHGSPPNPYLKLRVRRDHIIDDALVGLEMIAMESPSSLKKQLVVEFEGEQGIDEGGVSKEFFQLVVEEVFNPDFAMFTLNAETQTYWFNPTSFESDAQFTLIGIILGLAIYNNIILDVHFPMVLYRKLMGKKGTYYDLKDWNPTLSKGLQDLLSYEGCDVESVFLQTFRITYQDVFGTVLVHDLIENGDNILVNQSNKKEFVELYASFLLNQSVQKQFRAFKRGFQMVTDDSPLKLLFRPEEVELLVCGSKNFDFNALEESTDYDGGYTAETAIIRWFWELVHDFSLEQKQKLLQFATGSDRVPVGGLSKLKLVVARHGPDSDRLPTAHTCFNVLLLPEYSCKEKLEERLLKAINYSKGFGML